MSPKENTDPMGYDPRAFRLEAKWVKKIATMPKRPDGSHFVKIHLKNGSYQNAIVVNGEYITQHVLFGDEDIVDVTVAG